MKKILFLLAIIMFCGCSESFDEFAKKRMTEYINEYSNELAKKKDKTIEKLDIANVNIVYSNDSICVINCDVSVKEYGKNESVENLEYIIYKDFFQSNVEGKSIYYENLNPTHYYKNFKKFIDIDTLGVGEHKSFYETILVLKREFTEVSTK